MFLVWSGSEIVGMTAGAIRLIRGGSPGYDFRIAPVAIGTEQVSGMVPGIGGGCVGERVRCPENCAVAVVAGCLGREMARVHPGGGHAIVAAVATAWADIVMVERCWKPGNC